MKRRRVVYPPAKTATRSDPGAGVDARAAAAASRIVSINLNAMTGRPGIRPGLRVQIASGLYAGEIAVVESVVGGVIPAALVRTEAGRTRRVRTVDLTPAAAAAQGGGTQQAAESAIPEPTEP